MVQPILVLSDYDISPTHGFLPPETPALRSPYYAKWEAIVGDLHALLQAKKLRQTINHLPVLSTDYLETPTEWRRAYVCLVFMLNGYVWGQQNPEQRIPPPLTIPLLKVCKHWELPPIATYVGLCLWNYQPLVQDLACPRPEDLVVSCTFTGTSDERWFYLISVAFEAKGAPVIPLMLDAILAARTSDIIKVTESLKTFAQHLEDLIIILNRMYESCDPKVFYHQIRLFLAGSKSMEHFGLRNGLTYDDGTDKEEYHRAYAGGSNAQSSLIQFFDIVLGISHTSSNNQSFITNMRAYMPGKHRQFLERVMEITNIRTFVEERKDHLELVSAYNTCVELMCSMRNVHLRMVAHYIITQSRSEDVQRGYSGANGGSALSLPPAKRTVRGTGGTDLMPFLSQIRNETSQSKMRSLTLGSQGNILKPMEKQATQGARPREQENSNHGGQKFAAPVWLPLWLVQWRCLQYVVVLTASMATFLFVFGQRDLEPIFTGLKHI